MTKPRVTPYITADEITRLCEEREVPPLLRKPLEDAVAVFNDAVAGTNLGVIKPWGDWLIEFRNALRNEDQKQVALPHVRNLYQFKVKPLPRQKGKVADLSESLRTLMKTYGGRTVTEVVREDVQRVSDVRYSEDLTQAETLPSSLLPALTRLHDAITTIESFDPNDYQSKAVDRVAQSKRSGGRGGRRKEIDELEIEQRLRRRDYKVSANKKAIVADIAEDLDIGESTVRLVAAKAGLTQRRKKKI